MPLRLAWLSHPPPTPQAVEKSCRAELDNWHNDFSMIRRLYWRGVLISGIITDTWQSTNYQFWQRRRRQPHFIRRRRWWQRPHYADASFELYCLTPRCVWHVKRPSDRRYYHNVYLLVGTSTNTTGVQYTTLLSRITNILDTCTTYLIRWYCNCSNSSNNNNNCSSKYYIIGHRRWKCWMWWWWSY